MIWAMSNGRVSRRCWPDSGRPVADTRAVLNGVLGVMFTGSAWAKVPARYAPGATCHRRFWQWHDSGGGPWSTHWPAHGYVHRGIFRWQIRWQKKRPRRHTRRCSL
ncbi:transposase, partial [Paraburkholderia aspalathi]|nr:transposase [Paraburkholderia aspalathi]